MGVRLVRIGGSFFRRLIGRPGEQSPQHAKVHDRGRRIRTCSGHLLLNSLCERCFCIHEAGRRHRSRGCREHLGMDGESLTIRPRPGSKLTPAFILEPSVWPSLVRICICRRSNTHFLAVLCLELVQCMEGEGRQENSVKTPSSRSS